MNQEAEDEMQAAPSPEEIRAARKALGLTQTAAAVMVYCTCRCWQKWEAGECKMHKAIWELWQIKAKEISKKI